jgi:hypothetical protein
VLPGILDLVTYGGDTFTRVINLTTETPPAAPVAVNLTGVAIELGLRSGTTTLFYRDDPVCSVTNATGGIITLAFPPALTRELAERHEWRYEITVEASPTQRTTYLVGALTVTPEVAVAPE